MHILLLEDDSLIRSSLQGVLGEFGRVYLAISLRDAYETLQHSTIDLAIIDRVLPDGDGAELVEHLQDVSPQTKSLIITSLAGLPSRLEGWRAGADDYIAKPFSREEVRLRIKRLARLHKELTSDWEEGGNIRLNKSTGEIFIGTKNIHVRPKEFAIFLVLWRNRDRVVSKHQVAEAVWGAAERPTKNTLGVYVRRLRMSLRGSGLLLRTIHSYGFSLSEGTKN